MSNHALFRCNSEEAWHIKDAKAFDIDGTALVVDSMVTMRVGDLNLRALMKIVGINDGVYLGLTAPSTEVGEHLLHFGYVKFTGTAKTQDVVVVEVEFFEVSDARREDPLFEMCGALVLLRVGVAHEARVDTFLRCS